MSDFKSRFKVALSNRGLKQSQIVQKTGIAASVISCYASGRYEPKGDNLFLIAKALRVSPEWLSGKDVPPEEINSPVALSLSDGEIRLLELFRSASPYQREIILQLLAAKITPKE